MPCSVESSAERLRIAFLVSRFPAISETFILSQITGLLDRGHSVDIFATRPSVDDRVHPEVESYRLEDRTRKVRLPDNPASRVLGGAWKIGYGLLRSPKLTLRSLNLLRYGRESASLRLLHLSSPFRGHWDLIHCHYGLLGNLGVRIRELGADVGAVVTSFHGFDLTSHIRRCGEGAYAELFDKGDLFLPISRCWKSRLLELGCPADRIIVHHMGVDCSRLRYRPRLPKASAPVELVSVGRFVEKKGFEYGLRAVSELLKGGMDVRYTVVGDGRLRPGLERLAAELGICERVELTGSLDGDRVMDVMNGAHFLMAPSVTSASGDMEGIPVVLMEAMALGLPVVATRHSGIPELVEDGVTGLLVDERDHIGLADAVRSLALSPQMSASMAEAGRERVEREFSSRRQLDRQEQIYRRLAAGEAVCE